LSAKRSTPCENSRAVYILPHYSGTVIDSEKVLLTRKEVNHRLSNEPSTMVVQYIYVMGHIIWTAVA